MDESGYKLNTWGGTFGFDVTCSDSFVWCCLLYTSSSTPFYGVRSMFHNPTADGLHPNAQGDLLMAGNLAKGMGLSLIHI